MPDVIDFLVLRQFYDEARQRDWQSCKSVLTGFYMPVEISLSFYCNKSVWVVVQLIRVGANMSILERIIYISHW